MSQELGEKLQSDSTHCQLRGWHGPTVVRAVTLPRLRPVVNPAPRPPQTGAAVIP